MTGDPDRTAVFLGPSLPLADARRILPARYLPPVRFGDVYRLIGGGVDNVVVIDGVFHGSTPVWPRELLAAMKSGIRVFGAASMGALRAAELRTYGMVGLGTVFRWYVDGDIDGDDEVALLHTGPEQGYSALSMPLVNLRYCLREASARGVVSAAAAADLAAAMKALPFWQRTLRELRSTAAYEALDGASRERLDSFFAGAPVDLKRRDAEEALAEVARRLGETAQTEGDAPRLPISEEADGGGYYDRFRLLYRGIPRAAGDPLDGRAVVDRAFADPARRRRLQAALSARFFTRQWTREAGVRMPEDAWEGTVSGDPARFGLSPALQDTALWPFGREAGALGTLCDPADLARALPHVAAWCRVTGASPDNAVLERSRERFRDRVEVLRRRGGGAADEDDYLHAVWALEKGPIHFGFTTWSPAAELIRELEITGALAVIAARWEEDVP